MIVYRASKNIYSKDLSGEGARLAGGRWNSKSIPLVYTSESKALCMFELAVHVPINSIPTNYKIVKIEISDSAKIEEILIKNLPSDWGVLPYSNSTQKIGDDFVMRNKKLVLKVPSVVVSGSFNYLINPRHKDISSVKIIDEEIFDVDRRLLKKKYKSVFISSAEFKK